MPKIRIPLKVFQLIKSTAVQELKAKKASSSWSGHSLLWRFISVPASKQITALWMKCVSTRSGKKQKLQSFGFQWTIFQSVGPKLSLGYTVIGLDCWRSSPDTVKSLYLLSFFYVRVRDFIYFLLYINLNLNLIQESI